MNSELESSAAAPPLESASLESVYAPVRPQTAFEETVDRLGRAIKLGLLAPGMRLPAERELCARFGIARSTLRQALGALGQSGHLHATRGRGGGTFVADPQPPATPPTAEIVAAVRRHDEAAAAREMAQHLRATEHVLAGLLPRGIGA